MVWTGFSLSVIAIYLAFRDEDLGRIYMAMTSVDWRFLVVSLPLLVLSLLIRAHRWRCFIKNDHSTLRARYNAVNIGFLATNILPLRVGELVRAIALARRMNRSRMEILATIVAERFFDVLGLVILFVLVLPRVPFENIQDPAAGYASVYKYSRQTLTFWSEIAVAGGLAGFLLACNFGRRIGHFLTRLIGVNHPYLHHLIGAFFDGLEALWHGRKVVPALALSILLWFCVAVNFWIAMAAFPSSGSNLAAIVGLSGAVFVNSILCAGVAAPSAPGFVGLWQLSTKVAFLPYPEADSSAVLAFAILVFLLIYFATILLGLESLRSEGIAWSEVSAAQDAETLHETT